MSIESEIKKNKMRVFRRVYMRRRQANGEYESTWQRIDNSRVKRFGSISYSVDDVVPNFYKFSGLRMQLLNNDGFFSDTTEDKSFFYQYLTRYKTMVKVEAGYEADDGTEYPTNPSLYVGLVSEDVKYQENSIVDFTTKHLSVIFEEFPSDRINGMNSTQTASEVVERIRDFTDSNGTAIFQKYISSGAWDIQTTTTNYKMVTSTTLQGLSCWRLMRKLAEAENYVLYIDANANFVFRARDDITTTAKYHFSGIGDTDKTYGHNIMELETSENIRKVYNRIKVKYEQGDTTTSYYIKNEEWNWADSSSSFLYGVREYIYSNQFLNTATSETIADTIFTEFSFPKNEVKIKSKFVPHLMVQDRVSATYKTQRYTSDGSQWGYFLWGTGRWGERPGYNINIDDEDYRITNLRHNIDSMQSQVTLREL